MFAFMKQISIFILLGKTLMHFCPNKKYEKYIKLLFGFMVVLQFASPLFSMGSTGTLEEYEKNRMFFEQQLTKSMEAVGEKWFLYQDRIEKQIEKEKAEAEKLVKEKEAESAEEEERYGNVEKVKIEVTVRE